MAENLGQYTVVVGADYTQFASQIQAISNILSESASKISGQINSMVDGVSASVKGMADVTKASVAESTSAINSMGRSFDAVNADKASNSVRSFGDTADRVRDTMRKTTQEVNVFSDVISKAGSHLAWMASAGLVAGLLAMPVAISNVTESTDALNAKIRQNLELADQYHNNNAQLNADLQTLNSTAQTYAMGFGMSMNEVQEGMQILSRRFKDVASVQYLTSVAMTMSKLDMVDMKKSAQDLEAVMLQFGLNAEGTRNFLNDFTVAVHTARVTGTDLLDALERSGSAFKAFGMGTRESIAAIAALSTETARSGANVGQTFKSIASNFDTKNAVKALQSYNIELYKTDANGMKVMRDGANVFQELQNLFQKLDDEGKRKLAFSLSGGKYQVNQMMAFLADANSNFTKFMDEMKNKSSDEMTQKLLETSMETYQTKIQQFKASMQVLAQTLGNMLLPTLKNVAATLAGTAVYLQKHAATVLMVAKALAALAGTYITVKGVMFAYSAAEWAVTAATTAHAAVMGVLNGIMDTAKAAIVAYNLLVGGTSAVEAAATVTTGILSAAFDALTASIYSIPIAGWLLLAITALGVALYELYEHWNTVKNACIDLWNDFVDTISNIIAVMIVAIPPLGVALYVVYTHWDTVIGALKELWRILTESVHYAVVKIGQYMDNAARFFGEVKDAIVQHVMGIISGIDQAIPGFEDWCSRTFGILYSFAKKVFEIAAKVKTAIREMLHASKDDSSDDENKPKSLDDEINGIHKKAQEESERARQQMLEDMGNNSPAGSPSIGNQIPDGKGGSRGEKNPPDNSPERLIHDFLAKKGWSEEMIAGQLGNVDAESSFNPGAYSYDASSGGHYGLMQWSESRWQELQKNVPGDSGELSTQAAYMDWEFKNHPQDYMMPVMNNEFGQTPEGYAAAIDKYFERSGNTPGDENDTYRQGKAREYYDRFSEGEGKKKELVDPIERNAKTYSELKKVIESRIEQEELKASKEGRYYGPEEKLATIKQYTGTMIGGGSGNYSAEQNWKENLLSGDDAIDTLTAQKMHLVAAKYAELTGGQMPTATSMHRYGNGNSDHDSGHAFDLSDSNLENNPELRQKLMDYARTVGLNPLDEYDPANYQWGKYNVHFSDHGVPIDGEQNATPISAGASPEFQKYLSKAIDDAVKDRLERQSSQYEMESARDRATVDAIHKLESTIIDERKKGGRLGTAEEKIYESMLKSNTLKNDSPEKMRENAKRFNAIADYYDKFNSAVLDASKRHTDALDSMTQKELEFAQKLGLVNSQDMWKYNMGKNERDYAAKQPMLEDNLSKTAKDGKNKEIIDAYRKLMAAESEEDVKHSAEYLISLSKDVDATKKALDTMMDADNKYYSHKEELEQQAFLYENRYIIQAKDSFTNSFEQALEDTLNRTKSFADNVRSIFKAMWNAIVKQISQDIAGRFSKIMSQAIFKLKPNSQQGIGGSKSTGGSTKNMFADMFNTQSIVNQLNPVKTAVQSTFQQISAGSNIVKQTVTGNIQQMTQAALQGETTKQAASAATAATVQADSTATKSSVIADIGTMITQMLAAMAIMFVMSALFGGGGSETSTSTSSVNLGRNPDSYYSTPTFTVPSMDIGGNVEKDMLIYAHKSEMVLTPDQANVIREQANNNRGGGSQKNQRPVVVKSTFAPNLIDSRGIKDVYHQTNRDLAKQVKSSIRNGHLTARGLV